MTTAAMREPALADQLATPLTVAGPDIVGALCVFPLIADRAPRLDYVAFAEGRRRGVTIKELAAGAEVGDLVVHNPLELPVLFYEGEEVHGAQQNRTVDISVLVPAHGTLRVPVSCVEQGRWDDRRHSEPFAPAPQAAYPELRRLKNERVRERLAAGQQPRAAQGEVWEEIAAKSARHGAHSDTGALHDVFEHRRDADRPRRARDRDQVQPGRDAHRNRRALRGARLHQRRRGLRRAPRPARRRLRARRHRARRARHAGALAYDARDFLALLLDTPTRTAAAVGLGEALRFGFGGLGGTALATDGELVTLTAFAGKGR